MSADDKGRKDATPQTCAHNHSFLDALPFGDTRRISRTPTRGFIATLPDVDLPQPGRPRDLLAEGLCLPRRTSRRPTRSTRACGGRRGST